MNNRTNRGRRVDYFSFCAKRLPPPLGRGAGAGAGARRGRGTGTGGARAGSCTGSGTGATVRDAVVAAHHVVGCGGVDVSRCLVVAFGTGVGTVLTEAVRPTIEHGTRAVGADFGVGRGVGFGGRRSCRRRGDGSGWRSRSVGAMIPTGLGGKFAEPLFVSFVEVLFKVFERPVGGGAGAPGLDGGGEDAGFFEERKG